MTFAELGAGLKALTVDGARLQFAHFGWNSAPSGDYGVYSESDNEYFDSNNRHAETKVIGSVHYFTRSDNEKAKKVIEDYFRSLQDTNLFAWYLNTIQYEEDTNFIHYEWIVEVA